MYIQVVTIDGKHKTVLTVSKLTKIIELKGQIQEEFLIDTDKQALFFRGKHLENDATLYDYRINLNNVIQVMIKTDKPSSPVKSSKKSEAKNADDSETEPEEEEVGAESEFYKVGDDIDCSDASIGSWFEAKILKIVTKGDQLLYKVQWDLPDTKDDEPFNVEESKIRPRAWKVLNFNDLDLGQRVMINHNLEEPKKIGNWYDFTISKIKNTKTCKELQGSLHIGHDVESLKECTIPIEDRQIYDIEKPVPLTERDDALIKSRIPTTRRKLPVKCNHCKDNPNRSCRECSCRACGKKHDPHLTLLCDECNDAYHMACLKPPMTGVPEEDDWYCPNCKNNENEIVKVGEKNRVKKQSNKLVGGDNKRDWGKGFACVGRTKTCTIVNGSHRGPIPGIPVGTNWFFRFQVSEAGVHRPPVAGIAGKASDCAYSIVLSGGYEDDVDDGVEFLYTGAGGRDLSGNKRTAKQSCDQTLTMTNLALARNCNAPVNEKEGNAAKDWKKGIPIRVVRNYKLRKHSKYAPEKGNRYDGIYKVVKYWQEAGQSGFKVWRYRLKRDDPTPPPWTKEGKALIKSLGIEEVIMPEGYLEAQEKKSQSKNTETKTPDTKKKTPGQSKEKSSENKSPNKRLSTSSAKKRKSEHQIDRFFEKLDSPSKKVKKVEYSLSKEVQQLIEKDTANVRLWNICNEFLAKGQTQYLEKVSTEFACVVCQDLAINPNTTPCSHNICVNCLKRSFSCKTYECPMCRNSLEKDYDMKTNKTLSLILSKLFPGYTDRK